MKRLLTHFHFLDVFLFTRRRQSCYSFQLLLIGGWNMQQTSKDKYGNYIQFLVKLFNFFTSFYKQSYTSDGPNWIFFPFFLFSVYFSPWNIQGPDYSEKSYISSKMQQVKSMFICKCKYSKETIFLFVH